MRLQIRRLIRTARNVQKIFHETVEKTQRKTCNNGDSIIVPSNRSNGEFLFMEKNINIV